MAFITTTAASISSGGTINGDITIDFDEDLKIMNISNASLNFNIHPTLFNIDQNNFILRGINCMSQCKRPCVVSLTSNNFFTYVFGDIDPDRKEHIDSFQTLDHMIE